MALCFTCRTIHAESAHLPFTFNAWRFRTDVRSTSSEHIAAWFARFGLGSLRHLRRIETYIDEISSTRRNSYNVVEMSAEEAVSMIAELYHQYPESLRKTSVHHRFRVDITWTAGLCDYRSLPQIEAYKPFALTLDISSDNDPARLDLRTQIMA